MFIFITIILQRKKQFYVTEGILQTVTEGIKKSRKELMFDILFLKKRFTIIQIVCNSKFYVEKIRTLQKYYTESHLFELVWKKM